MVVVEEEEEEEEVPVISLCLCVYLLLQSHLIFWVVMLVIFGFKS